MPDGTHYSFGLTWILAIALVAFGIWKLIRILQQRK